jgi:uncharacterized protein YjiS (DUF1127 family)
MSSSYMWQTTRPTYADYVTAAHRTRSAAIRTFVRFAKERYRAWRRHRRRIAALRDLEALNDHQLADIGLSRAMLRETVEQLLAKQR